MFQAMVTRRHSPRTLSSPRSENWRNPRADLTMPNTGSGVCLRWAQRSLRPKADDAVDQTALVDFGWRFPRESRWKNVEIPTVSETFSVGRLGALGIDAALQFLSRSP